MLEGRDLCDWLSDPLWDDYPGMVLRMMTSEQRRMVCGLAVRKARPMNDWRMLRAHARSKVTAA